MIFVQERWLVNDGWNVPFHVFRQLIERALTLHDSGTPVPKSLEELCFQLVPDSIKFARALNKIKRYPCVRCGCVPEQCNRKPTRRGERVPKREVFCSSCYKFVR